MLTARSLKVIKQRVVHALVDQPIGSGRDFSAFGGLGWIGTTIAKVLKI